MNKAETSRVIATLAVAYPKFYADMDKERTQETIELWNYQFRDFPGNEVLYAIQQYISNDEKGFPPTIGKIKKTISKNYHINDTDPEEAWAHVLDCAQGSYSTPHANFKQLTKLEQRAIGTPLHLREIGQIEDKKTLSFEKDRFFKRYNEVQKENAEMESLPSSTRNFIENLTMNLAKRLSMDDETEKN